MSNQNEKPDILVNVNGSKPPRAAEFGKDVSGVAGVREAFNARRGVKPGQYDHKRQST
jgi:hypothetical protein